MKLMSYNILDGGKERLPLIIEVIKKEAPDYLTINEANTFAENDSAILKQIAEEIGFPYYDISLSGEYDYHVAVFSKYPFLSINKLQPLMRACIVALVETELGKISIASLHLTPYSENQRHPEINLILDFQKQYKNRVLMGDMNSLSKYDDYNHKIIEGFDEIQTKKFTTDGQLRFDAINKMMAVGYVDSALIMKRNKDATAPTSLNDYLSQTPMRLDYIFISPSLLSHHAHYSVIKNDLTHKASDHFPIIVELK
ncbi:MAG: endonuclease/exonuclease/phosphatase family protein [Candidatus Roizmanbacteria bacterium]|nr:MAG: endonuclease/exonuclease/phosphatase family protein [Candidatus Roizmanbacteria bacterium]